MTTHTTYLLLDRIFNPKNHPLRLLKQRSEVRLAPGQRSDWVLYQKLVFGVSSGFEFFPWCRSWLLLQKGEHGEKRAKAFFKIKICVVFRLICLLSVHMLSSSVTVLVEMPVEAQRDVTLDDSGKSRRRAAPHFWCIKEAQKRTNLDSDYHGEATRHRNFQPNPCDDQETTSMKATFSLTNRPLCLPPWRWCLCVVSNASRKLRESLKLASSDC